MSAERAGVVGPVPPGEDPDTYDRRRRRVLWLLPTGLYVVGSRAGDKRNLMTVSWVTQVALTPKLVGMAVEATALTHELISEGGVFALSILPRDQRELVRRFAKPVGDVSVDDNGSGTMQGAAVRAATTGAPILEMAVAWLDCEVRHRLALGSHTWFAGEVVDCDFAPAGPPAPVEMPGADPGDVPATPGAKTMEVLRMEDTRMNYGG